MASFTGMALKPLLDGLLGLGKALSEAGKIPEYKTVIDAYEQIREMQRRVYDVEDELRIVKKELSEIREAEASVEGSKIYRDLLWLKEDDFPRRLHCWDAERKLIHVNRNGPFNRTWDSKCPRCKEVLEDVPGPHNSVW